MRLEVILCLYIWGCNPVHTSRGQADPCATVNSYVLQWPIFLEVD